MLRELGVKRLPPGRLWSLQSKVRKMDEKQKRLRTHVVKEIVETEKVYCGQIEFVTQVSEAVGNSGVDEKAAGTTVVRTGGWGSVCRASLVPVVPVAARAWRSIGWYEGALRWPVGLPRCVACGKHARLVDLPVSSLGRAR